MWKRIGGLGLVMIMSSVIPGWTTTTQDIAAQIEQVYLDVYGTQRTQTQLTDASLAVWVQNILTGATGLSQWGMPQCGDVWTVAALRCRLLAVQPPPLPPPSSPALSSLPDMTPWLDQQITSICQSATTRTLRLPVGDYRLAAPTILIPCAVNLVGEGKAVTRLIKDFPGKYAIGWTGGQDPYGGGSLRDLSILTVQDGGIAVWIAAHLETDGTVISKNPHGFLIDNVQIGRMLVNVGTWTQGIYLDGSHNPDNTLGVAPGIRAVSIRNTSVFGATTGSFYLFAGLGISLLNVDCFGSGPNVSIVLDGQTQGVLLQSRTCPLQVLSGTP